MNQDIPSPSVALRVAGVDLGDLTSHVCILDGVTGEVLEEARIRTQPKDMQNFFGRHATMRVAIEVGTHSAWSSRAIASAGHEVTIANAARVRLIHGGQRKNDKLDAEKLARLLRYDRNLLSPIQHRSESSQHAMAVLRSRVTLIRARTMLVNHVRGVMKSFGLRVAACTTKVFADRASRS